MLRITVSRSASATKKYYSEKYYSEGQDRQNYYSEKDHSIGTWGGKSAERLGLKGDIDKSDFASLCDNHIPGTNKGLTGRNNSERRVGYDFTFNASKSVSLAYSFGNDEDKKHILKAFNESVKEAMSEIESGMQTRVRAKGQNGNRETGNIVYGEFTHFTSRPVDGISDPHLHIHCFVFNATYDEAEKKWKAGEFGQVKKDASYYEAIFHSSLASKLQSIGYDIEKSKNGFEIKGISRKTIEKFSRRTEEIEHLAEAKNITNREDKAKLGAKTRESKRKSSTEAEQIKNWNARLNNDEQKTLSSLRNKNSSDKKKDSRGSAIEAVEYSLNHHLERKSVTTDKEILATAIRSSLGDANFQEVLKAFKRNNGVISLKEDNQTLITTKAALLEENYLIANGHASKGKFKPINEGFHPKVSLTDEQHNAVLHALTSTDGITIIAGKAGTGKTTLMKEVQRGINEAGKNIFAFAPSAEASRVVQRKEGFESAETIATLIQSKALQEKAKDSIIWIDEAGMISNKDMNRVLDIAKQQNARLILTGDTKQHTSVERGDALRILQQEAKIVSIQVSKIQRQKSKQYKDAVSFLSKSDTSKGFDKLNKMGAIHEIADADKRIKTIADDYFLSVYGKNKNKPEREVLVISPTHIEGDKVTERIRIKLKDENILTGEDRKFRSLKNLQLTVAEKQNAESYREGNLIVFHQNVKGFKAGLKYEISGKASGSVLVQDDSGKKWPLPFNKASQFNVYEPKELPLLKGDKIRITGNGKANDGKHLFNGSLYQVTGFDRHGNIKLSNGSSLPKDYGHFTSGYVMTSHASQGKTVDKVIISQSSMSFRAASKEQFYVSVSRGKQAVSIYTDDKADLLNAVSKSGDRKSAIELLRQKTIQTIAVEINRRNIFRKAKEIAMATVEKVITRGNK